MLVFVVDSVDRERLLTARQELHALLAQEPRLPLVVLANKQVGAPLQLPGGCSRPNCLSRGTPRGNLNAPNPPGVVSHSLSHSSFGRLPMAQLTSSRRAPASKIPKG